MTERFFSESLIQSRVRVGEHSRMRVGRRRIRRRGRFSRPRRHVGELGVARHPRGNRTGGFARVRETRGGAEMYEQKKTRGNRERREDEDDRLD